MSSWESLEHIGPLTRTVADAALVLSVMAGPDDRDRLSLPSADVDWRASVDGRLPPLRVAYSPRPRVRRRRPRSARALIERAAAVFERDLGCVVEERADPGWDDPYESFWATVVAESDLGRHAAARRRAGRPHVARTWSAVLRADWTAEQLTSADVGRKAVVQRGLAVLPAATTCC